MRSSPAGFSKWIQDLDFDRIGLAIRIQRRADIGDLALEDRRADVRNRDLGCCPRFDAGYILFGNVNRHKEGAGLGNAETGCLGGYLFPHFDFPGGPRCHRQAK